MIGLVRDPRKCGASHRFALRAWQYLVLALSLWGTVLSVPAFSLAIRTVGMQVIDLADPGEGESEDPAEEPGTDAESFGMVATRSRLAHDLRVVDRYRARRAAAVSLRQGGRCVGERHASFRCGGNAVQLPLRC